MPLQSHCKYFVRSLSRRPVFQREPGIAGRNHLGLFPALQSAGPEISQVMQAGTRRLTGSVKGRHMHTALMAGQIALTLLLMTEAGAAFSHSFA